MHFKRFLPASRARMPIGVRLLGSRKRTWRCASRTGLNQPSYAYRVRETVGRTSPGSQSVIFCQDPTETTEFSSFVVGQLNAGISLGR